MPTLQFQLAIDVPAGAAYRFEAGRQSWRSAGWFDNSPNNPANPDPKAEVRWGEQSWEEMMIGFLDVAVPSDMDRRSFFQKKPAKSDD